MTPGGRAGGTALVCWPCVSTTAVGTTMMMTSRKDMAPMMNDLAELKTHQCEAMQSNDMDMMTVEARSGWLAGKIPARYSGMASWTRPQPGQQRCPSGSRRKKFLPHINSPAGTGS
jgi:hypothetical protein